MCTRPALALLLLAAACGGDDVAGDELEDDAGAQLEADAGNGTRDAAVTEGGPSVTPDGGTPVDAGGARYEVVDGPSTCTGGSTSGSPFRLRCLTSAELAGGCTLAQRPRSGGGTEVTVDRATVERATYAVQYGTAGETYLCTGTPPSADWTCGNVALADCYAGGACTPRYLVEPLPVQLANCR